GVPHLLPEDQREREASAAVYVTARLAEPLELLGYPRLVLHADSSAEVITFVARLCDVAPDGSSALITNGILNATHRESHRAPAPGGGGGVTQVERVAPPRGGPARRAPPRRPPPATPPSPTFGPPPRPPPTPPPRAPAPPPRLILPVLDAPVAAPEPPAPNL